MSEAADPFCRALAGYLAERLDREIVFVEDIPWQDRKALLLRGEIDVGWICGVDYVGFETAPVVQVLATPVSQGERYQEKPVYFSEVIVRKDSPFHAFHDLQGARWAYNETGSFSGYLVMLHQLAKMGVRGDYFREGIATGAHTNSIRMVLDNHADVAAIDSTAFAQYFNSHPERASDLRVIENLGPYPAPPWVATKSLPQGEFKALRENFLNMANDPLGKDILSVGLFKQFARAVDSDYDPIREVVSSAQVISDEVPQRVLRSHLPQPE